MQESKILNKEQEKAVRHGDGPLLIIAGAGTGKTTVITERIKWLIAKEKVKPAEILALTFTDKAAREMEDRVDRALPYGYTQMWIMTFHAYGDRVLRQEAFHIGLNPGYKLMTEAESIMFFRKNIFAFDLRYFRPLGNPTKFIEGMLTHFSRLKDEDVSPNQYLDWAKEKSVKRKALSEEEKIELEKFQELANTYRKYEELKAKEGVMDFADLITNTLRLFRDRKNVLREYQNRFKYILIDEFQDTNIVQNELARLLAGNQQNLTVVADDDQAIYRWRGAAVSNVIQFKEHYPNTKIVVLTRNYRSTRTILDASYKLIQNNNPDRLEVKENIDKRLTSERRKEGVKIEYIYCERVEDEAEEVAKIIKSKQGEVSSVKHKEEQEKELYRWKDFAILVRANAHADPFVRALERAGIPYQFLGPGMLFRQNEVADLIAYLKLLSNLEDSVAAYRVLSMDTIAVPTRDIFAVITFARKVGLSIFDAIDVLVSYHDGDTNHWSRSKNYSSYLPYLSSQTQAILTKFHTMIVRHLGLIKKETAGQILYYFLEDTGMLATLASYNSVSEERKALNITKFFEKLKSYELGHEDASVGAIVDWIDMALELGESPLAANIDWSENDAVNILTVHSAKGLEFPVVFLVNLVSLRFPTSERHERIPVPDELIKEILPEGDYHMQEERRLFYVGMTRARDRLILTAAKYYGEGKREKKISPFIVESVPKEEFAKNIRENVGVKQLSFIDWKKHEEPVRPIVRHPVGYLSYSQINTFLTCPLQYKYRYVVKIPVPTSAAASFGTSMHAALQKFYELGIRNRELGIGNKESSSKPTKEDLFKLLDEVWIPVGYGTKAYEEKMKERGINMLSGFFDKAYDPNVIPKSLEQLFKIKVTPSLTLGGKIDRVDETKDGKLEIIDYKTGRRPTDKAISDNLQMTVYALAANDRGVYDRKIEDVILSFYFFDAQEKVSSTRTSKQLEEAKTKLQDIAEKIAVSDYAPTPGQWCDFCDFRLICPAWK